MRNEGGNEEEISYDDISNEVILKYSILMAI